MVVIADKRFEKTAKNYLALHGELPRKNLVYRDVNKLLTYWPGLFRSPDLMVISDRFFYPKNLSGHKGFALWSRFLTFSFGRLMLLKFVISRSILVRTTHFTDLVELPEKAKVGTELIDKTLNNIWLRSINDTRALNVYSSLVKDNHVDARKVDILVAPNALYRPPTGLFEIKKYSKLRIVIPGRIDERRRRYDWIEELPDDLSNWIEIALVGKVQAASDMRVLEALQTKGYDQIIKPENTFISFHEFDSELYSCDLLFVPLLKLSDAKREVDRNLGAFFDSVRYGKAILLPSDIIAPPELSENLITYTDNEDLIRILIRLSEDRKFLNNLKQKALNGSRRWTLKQNDFIEDLINLASKS